MQDLTIIFLTVNKVPKGWAQYQKEVLLKAAGGASIITISREPLDWGTNLIQTEEPSVINIYRQILRGAKEAKTPFIAIAEDDVLYNKEHYSYRPPMDSFAYNFSRWGVFTWGEPTYYWRERISNATLIAPRELAIKSLEDRFVRYPNRQIGELGKEINTRLPRYNVVTYYTTLPVIYFSHINAIDHLEISRRKRMSLIRAFDIPYWGRAEDLVKKFA